MKRLMLATTAALAIAAPVAAQTSAEARVESELMTMGYDAATIDMLTDAQVTELFVAISSEDESAVMELLRGYEATQSDGPDFLYDTARDDDTRAIVVEALAENGMAPGVADLLSDGEYTELYLAASGEDQTAVEQVIASFDFGKNDDGVMEIAQSSAERRVMSALEARGYTSAELAEIEGAEVTEIFIAMVSGDETEIDNAIESALNS
ncbi:hypothetical protein [Gymnodinialimonas hymeniacidonis]|uniref:hypothetical protein n=1 Tax=Gymnodinialimonas hymeniacidonis TaxID=3126508 RepID=UPI0034C6B7D0